MTVLLTIINNYWGRCHFILHITNLFLLISLWYKYLSNVRQGMNRWPCFYSEDSYIYTSRINMTGLNCPQGTDAPSLDAQRCSEFKFQQDFFVVRTGKGIWTCLVSVVVCSPVSVKWESLNSHWNQRLQVVFKRKTSVRVVPFLTQNDWILEAMSV